MKKIVNWTLAALIVGSLLAGSTACNTVKGMGEDVEVTGEAIKDAAQD